MLVASQAAGHSSAPISGAVQAPQLAPRDLVSLANVRVIEHSVEPWSCLRMGAGAASGPYVRSHGRGEVLGCRSMRRGSSALPRCGMRAPGGSEWRTRRWGMGGPTSYSSGEHAMPLPLYTCGHARCL
jgi:hypothetical protein